MLLDDFDSEAEVKTFGSVVNDDDILQMYLKDIGKTKLLTSVQEKLGKEIKEGTSDVANIALKTCSGKFATCQHRKKIYRAGCVFMDLVQEGSLGLIKAAQRFDYSRNLSSQLMPWWIANNYSLDFEQFKNN